MGPTANARGFRAVIAALLFTVACADDKPAAIPVAIATITPVSAAVVASVVVAPKASASASSDDPDDDDPPIAVLRPSPTLTKTYRLRACYHGALALKQARDSYKGSLGGSEPSANKIPRFPSDPEGGAPHVIRYDQFVRHCTAARTIKDAADPPVDTVLKDFGDYAMPLARLLQEANAYYDAEHYKDDGFKLGKEFHACLVKGAACETKVQGAPPVKNGFARLDGNLAMLREAMQKYEQANPIDKTAFTDSQRAADGAVLAATIVLLDVDEKPIDKKKVKADLVKLRAATDALGTFASSQGNQDPWCRNVSPQLMNFIDEATALSETPSGKITPPKLYKIFVAHNRVLEKNYSALQSWLRRTSASRPKP